jgi:hypothetical protein
VYTRRKVEKLKGVRTGEIHNHCADHEADGENVESNLGYSSLITSREGHMAQPPVSGRSRKIAGIPTLGSLRIHKKGIGGVRGFFAWERRSSKKRKGKK